MSIPHPTHHAFQDLTGRTFGRLIAVEYAGRNRTGISSWHCVCSCGAKKTATTKLLLRGTTRSCGCLAIEGLVDRSTRHGHATGRKPSGEYVSHKAMLERCRDEEREHYGAVGIKVCDRWRYGDGGKTGFECFLEDMGPKPSKLHSIDRLNVNGDYEPRNCRWATDKQQIRNRTNTRFVVYRGDRMALGDAAEKAGLPIGTVRQRLDSGWDMQRALETPRITKYLRKSVRRDLRGIDEKTEAA